MTTLLIVLTIVEIVALVVVLAVSQLLVGRQLNAIGADISEVAALIGTLERELGAAADDVAALEPAFKDMGAALARLGERAERLAGRS